MGDDRAKSNSPSWLETLGDRFWTALKKLSMLARTVLLLVGVFASQYQQRPETGGSGHCSIDRLARYARAPPFELTVHSWDIASTKGGGDWTVCAKFGLAKDSDGRHSRARRWTSRLGFRSFETRIVHSFVTLSHWPR